MHGIKNDTTHVLAQIDQRYIVSNAEAYVFRMHVLLERSLCSVFWQRATVSKRNTEPLIGTELPKQITILADIKVVHNERFPSVVVRRKGRFSLRRKGALTQISVVINDGELPRCLLF